MLSSCLFLVDAFLNDALQTLFDLGLCVSAVGGICINGFEHPYNPAAFLTLSTGIYLITGNMGGMTGDLLPLEMGIFLDQNLFDEHFRKSPQDRKLMNIPFFMDVISS
jgi:hypothetical protein